MLSVGDRVTDNVLQEDFEDATGLLVDEARDTFHTTTTSETTNGLYGYHMRGGLVEEDCIVLTGFVIPWMLSRKILR